jgi:SAM-dependent methyltransferase
MVRLIRAARRPIGNRRIGPHIGGREEDAVATEAVHAEDGRLTNAAFWDKCWSEYSLPAEVRKGWRLLYDVLTDAIDKHLPAGPEVHTLEIGGAPGGWLAYFARAHGHQVQLLDISEVGVRAAQENFRLLGLPPIKTVLGDMFSDVPVEPVDVVFSIGLIEHFDNLDTAVAAHAKFVKPGGLLIIACPNFLGLIGWYKKWFAPKDYAVHKLEYMDIDAWESFERALNLEVLEKRYLGGFEPMFFRRPERPRVIAPLIAFLSKVMTVLLNFRATRFQRERNLRWWDGYARGV